MNDIHLFLTILEPGSLRSGSQHAYGRVVFWVTNSSLCSNMMEGTRELSGINDIHSNDAHSPPGNRVLMMVLCCQILGDRMYHNDQKGLRCGQWGLVCKELWKRLIDGQSQSLLLDLWRPELIFTSTICWLKSWLDSWEIETFNALTCIYQDNVSGSPEET